MYKLTFIHYLNIVIYSGIFLIPWEWIIFNVLIPWYTDISQKSICNIWKKLLVVISSLVILYLF